MVTDDEIETLMAEAFHPLPVPSWWEGIATGKCLMVWTFIEPDALEPNRHTAMKQLRQQLEELARVPCVIHVYEKRPTKRQVVRSMKRFVAAATPTPIRRW